MRGDEDDTIVRFFNIPTRPRLFKRRKSARALHSPNENPIHQRKVSGLGRSQHRALGLREEQSTEKPIVVPYRPVSNRPYRRPRQFPHI
jgi:hypothetical protein